MMRGAAICRMLGLLLIIFSFTLFPPVIIEIFYHEGSLYPFVVSFTAIFFLGILLWFPYRKIKSDFKTRDGFLIVVLIWIFACLAGGIPFYLNFYPNLSFTDALFESVSGLSTTGATVLSHLDNMPHSILYYRQQLTLLGGIGVVVVALSILPVLGIGGMQLYIAETSGPVKTSRLQPRLKQTIKALWIIYLGLVVACTLAFWLAGMSIFDAIGHSFSSIATAGFSTHDANLAYYHSYPIEIVSIIFMILGATNFGLHYQFLRHKSLKIYWQDPEFMTYLKILAILSLISIVTLTIYGFYHHHLSKISIASIFTVVSSQTTTGFNAINLDEWPSFLPYLICFFCLIGGCGGSTSGGIKVLRFLVLKRQSARELKQLIHPDGVFSLYLGEEMVGEKLIQGIWGFVGIFTVLFILIVLGLIATGLDFRTAFGSAAGALANAGIGLGKTAITFENINNPSKWILTFAMFAGRLEILTILVLFTREYWKK